MPSSDQTEQDPTDRFCGHLSTHDPHVWRYADRERAARAAGLSPQPIQPRHEIPYACAGRPHAPHDQRCCREHVTHSMPHVGCILR